MDLSFKSLASTGILLGGMFWFLGGSKTEMADRNPSASDRDSKRYKKAESYRPSIPVTTASDGEATDVTVVDDEGAANAEEVAADATATTEAEGSAVPAANFETIRLEITKHLTQGNVDSALDFAEKKLDESVQASTADLSSIGYLHEFILQNADDPDMAFNATVSALRGAQNANVRRLLYDKFRSQSPAAVEDLDRELDASGVIVE